MRSSFSIRPARLFSLPPAILRGKRLPIALLAALVVAFAFADGLVMGSFAAEGSIRGKQMLYSAIKAPLLLMATSAMSWPSFFVLNTVAGLRDDFGKVMAALAGAAATLAIVLASTAPLTAVWYASDPVYEHAILFNAARFAVASLAAQLVLRRLYRPLIARNPRHRRMLVVWLITYAFVGVQLGWVLRPFIGQPGQPSQFLRVASWSNAYVAVWEIARRALM